jgi:nitroreductase
VKYEPQGITTDAGLIEGQRFLQHMDARRSVRMFSAEPVPREMIELAVATANTAPSGAHLQPWTFVAVRAPSIKSQIRVAAARTITSMNLLVSHAVSSLPLCTPWDFLR